LNYEFFIPLNVLSDRPPFGSGGRRVILIESAVDLDQLRGLPITSGHMHMFVRFGAKIIGYVQSASIWDDVLYVSAECHEAPIDLACSWAVTDVELESFRSRIWRVVRCRFVEIAVTNNPSFSGARVAARGPEGDGRK
jgi:hypothetical protein